MENLKFTIEDKEIAELFGRQNFSTKESAIFELVKNCYDAGSLTCDLYFDTNSIIIEDCGEGMDIDDIKQHWMHVGRSTKGYRDLKSKRVLAGSKGVGRFAIARLGDRAKINSKKINRPAVIWETDWITSALEEKDVSFEKGTYIVIEELRDVWRKKDIERLNDFLKRAYKSKDMEIRLHFEGIESKINQIFDNLKIGVNYVSKITLKYESANTTLLVNVESDEFKSDVKNIIGKLSPTYYKEEFNMQYEIDLKMEDNYKYLLELGDFSAELYFARERTTSDNYKKFMYKYNEVNNIDTGIILYRNEFSISSLDGKKDWLDIASRARKSPAAATHPSGSWRVRLNQLTGYVMIDKNINSNLKDMANRQGLEEDEYYTVFKEIIAFGISRFEKYRQTLIRIINEKNKLDEEIKKPEEKKVLKEFLRKPIQVMKMSDQELTSLANEVKDIQREAKAQSKARKESEQQHKYDVRILNVLATQGLRASAIAHELHNKRNSLKTGYSDIISALKEFGFWEDLISEEYTQRAYKNVPKILFDLEEINIKLIAFLDVMLNKIEKDNFNINIISLRETLIEITDIWKSEYSWVDLHVYVEQELLSGYSISKDVLEVIFDNLILNSIQHNELKDKLDIKINVVLKDNLLVIEYKDDGIGLDEKYRHDAKRILEVHETSRNDGHGLGMWMVNNTLNMYEGSVVEIDGEGGFYIKFLLKG